MNSKVAIIGAGISGLSTAYFLKEKNVKNITLFESKDKPGGVVSTFKNKKYKYEIGPNTLSVSDSRVNDMFNNLNLKIVYPASTASNRFIFKNKVLHKLPTSFLSFIFTNFFSLKTKICIIFEYFRLNKCLTKNESVYDFFTRKFNTEISDYVVNPFIAGTFSGDPRKLSLKHAFPLLDELDNKYGSIIKGFTKAKKKKYKIKRQIISFKNGLFDLIKSLSKIFDSNIKYSANITSISKIDNHFIIEYMNKGKIKSKKFDKVVITVPTYKFKDITFDTNLQPYFSTFKNIYYPPIVTATLAFKKNHIKDRLNGFGLLIPEKEKMNILGVLYLSSMFENSSPKDEALITVFIGGARQPKLTALSKEELEQLILSDLSKIFNITEKPVYYTTKYWNKSIPQYGLDYQKHLDKIDYIESHCTGLFFNGNFRNGISLENNIINSLKITESIFGQ